MSFIDSLSAKDICSIIKECHKSGVTSFVFGELAIYFDDFSKSSEDSLSNGEYISENMQKPVVLDEKEKIRQKLRSEEDRMAELMILDPQAFENEQEKQLNA